MPASMLSSLLITHNPNPFTNPQTPTKPTKTTTKFPPNLLPPDVISGKNKVVGQGFQTTAFCTPFLSLVRFTCLSVEFNPSVPFPKNPSIIFGASDRVIFIAGNAVVPF